MSIVTVKTTNPQPVITDVTITLTQEEAQALYEVLGHIVEDTPRGLLIGGLCDQLKDVGFSFNYDTVVAGGNIGFNS